MNILYIGFFELPDKDAAAHRVVNNAKALIKGGNRIIFIDEKKDSISEDILENKSSVEGCEVWSSKRPQTLSKYVLKMVSIKNIIAVVNQYAKIDIIIAYNYPSIALNRLQIFCKRRGIKLVSDCTEWYSGKEYTFPRNILSAMDSFYRMRIVHKKLDGMICISSFLQEYYKNQKCVIKIPPLVDIENDIWNQEKYKWDNTTLNIIYAGSPGRNKETLLPILQAINTSLNKDKIIFRIVGITEEQAKESLPYDISIVNRIRNNVKFLGRLSHDETVKLVASSDFLIFIRPQNRVSMAGFSTKFAESISCGTAVITTDTGDLKNIIEENSAGYIIEDVNELCKLLDRDFNYLKQNAVIRNRNMFDYKGYTEVFSEWIKNLDNCTLIGD